jgi:putative methionine-R-sulfoxide reductase with GAF domain
MVLLYSTVSAMEPRSTNTPVVADSFKWAAERRHRSRSRIFTPAYATFDGSNALDLHELLNISQEGFAVQAPPEIPVSQTINLRLILSEGHGSISAQGRVAWINSGRLGIQLEPLDPEPQKQLEAWLFLNAMRAPAEEQACISEERAAAASSSEQSEPELSPEEASLLNALDSVRREVLSLSHHPQAVLQTIADRAFTLTQATGCAIAVQEGEIMVCRGRVGEDAPPVGASFQTGSGFSGECVHRKTALRCDDAETDSLVDRESCRALGIRSLLAVPILSGDSVIGLLEVFSPVAGAFSERHGKILIELAGYAASSVAALVPPAPSTPTEFLEQPEETRHRIPLRRSHIILLMAAFALLAGVVGYLAAPGLQRSFGQRREPVQLSSSDNATASPPPAAHAPSTQATTLEQLRQLAEKGDPAAQFGLGAHYAIGDGVKLDNAEAARWFIKAAEQGHVIAQDTMGAYYWAGRGVPKDLRKAYFWSLLGRAGNNETSKYRIVALNALLSREEIEAARQDAERWIRERTLAAKSSSK